MRHFVSSLTCSIASDDNSSSTTESHLDMKSNTSQLTATYEWNVRSLYIMFRPMKYDSQDQEYQVVLTKETTQANNL